MKEENDITDEIIALRKLYREETSTEYKDCEEFLKDLPRYCDWLEEKIIASDITKKEILCGYDRGCGNRMNGRCDLYDPTECSKYIPLNKQEN